MGKRSGRQEGIKLDQDIRVDMEIEAVAAKGDIDLVAGRFDHLGGMHPARLRRNGPGVDPRHLQNVLEQPMKPLDFRENQIALFTTLGICEPRGLKIVSGDPNRREWRTEIMLLDARSVDFSSSL
jgi:hypothetical protein